MNPFFPFLRIKWSKNEVSDHPLIIAPQHPHNITEGSEFLDDVIRTHDQPVMYTEESIAVGCPDDLL
jgi:hypothetical protein